MAKIVKGITLESGYKTRNRVTLDLYLDDGELQMLESFRTKSEKWLRKHSSMPFPEAEEYTLDDAVMYIVGEVLSGRARYLDLGHAFSD